jgi:cytochrome c-type biogenesis protein CcmH
MPMIRRVSLAIVAFVIAALFLAFSAPAQQTAPQSPRAKKLGNQVKCMCGGCNDAAGSCYHSGGTFSGPCPMALEMLKKMDAHVANNDSDSATLNAFVQEYGPLVLIEPPKSGFNLAAWIMPIAVPLVAFFAVWEVVRRWRHRAALTPTAGPGAPAVPHDLLDRVRADADQDDA